ncbi:MAG: hypothetical protein PHF87_09020 [Desulfotomaculaceae bacterium]|nr:hypothetical protein [Desulfotomaculaceae bacterium]
MPTYNYPMVYIESLASFKTSLLISDKIFCRVYDSEGSITNRCRKGGIYNLVVKQDVVYGDPRVDLAVYEAAPAGTPRFALSHGAFRNNVRGLYFDNPDLDNPWAVDKWEEEEVMLLWGLTTTSQRAVPKQFPVTVFDNLEYCELLILFNGGYAVIKEGRDAPDDTSRKKIAQLHDALTMLTGR